MNLETLLFPSFSLLNLPLAMRRHNLGVDNAEQMNSLPTKFTFERHLKHIQIVSESLIVTGQMLMRIQYFIWNLTGWDIHSADRDRRATAQNWGSRFTFLFNARQPSHFVENRCQGILPIVFLAGVRMINWCSALDRFTRSEETVF